MSEFSYRQFMAEGEKGWLGGNDYKTGESCFEYDMAYSYGPYCPDIAHLYDPYIAAFDAVCDALAALADVGMVEFIYRDLTRKEKRVVAFRYTSDAAYDAHRDRIVQIGSDLGRGVWDPFNDSHQFEKWFGREPAPENLRNSA